MVLAAFLFSLMSVAVKFAALGFTSAELVMYRGLIGVLLMAALLRSQGVSLRSPVPFMHVRRSLAGVISLWGWFYSISELSLATATTLNFTSSVWLGAIVAFGALLHGRIHRLLPLLCAMLAGFVGVALMLQPTLADDQWMAGTIGLLSGLLAGWAYMLVSALGRAGEPEGRTVFYFALGTLLAGTLASMVQGLSAWTWSAAVWLLPMGILASLGQWCMTRAYSRGATLVVASLQYSGVIFAVLFGVLLFEESIVWQGWLGMALIVASGIAATAWQKRASA